MSLGAGLLLGLGGVQQSGDDRRRTDAHRDPGLHEFGAALLARSVVFVSLGHSAFSMGFEPGLEA